MEEVCRGGKGLFRNAASRMVPPDVIIHIDKSTTKIDTKLVCAGFTG